jgi:hypothetical protein
MADDFDIKVDILSAPGEMPLHVRAATGGRTGIARIALGALIGIAGFTIWTGAMPLVPLLEAGQSKIVAVAVVGVGLILMLRGVFSRSRDLEYVVTPESVEQVTGPGKGWTEPLSAYRGVSWRRRESTEEWTRHVIELAHPEPGRNVPLFARASGRANKRDTFNLVRDAFKSAQEGETDLSALKAEGNRLARQATGDDVRDVWEGLSALLQVPAIDARSGEKHVRDVADLDKSIADLADEGKIRRAWDDRPAPASLKVERLGDETSGEALKVTILASPLPSVIGPVFLGIGGIVILTGLFNFHFGAILSGVLLGGMPMVMKKLERGRERFITISRDALAYENPMRQGTSREDFTARLSDIERVHVARVGHTAQGRVVTSALAEGLAGKVLVISTDQRERRIGTGLPNEALEWLRDYIESAIANA